MKIIKKNYSELYPEHMFCRRNMVFNEIKVKKIEATSLDFHYFLYHFSRKAGFE